MRLYRAHGLGNDYLVLETGDPLDPDRVRAICDRHRGVGSDGILEPIAGGSADYGVRIWNPDGSIAEKSGNGLRIYARWLADRGAKPSFTVWTGHDTVTCEVGADEIAVAMGRARVSTPETVDEHVVSVVSVGNPHCVVFVDRDPDEVPWRAWGASLEVHPRFPARTNVQIARRVDDATAVARIWERGAGETLASGSSACAIAAAGVATGRLKPGRIAIHMPGGTLAIDVTAELDLVLRGPVEVIGRIEVDPRWLAAGGNLAP